MFGASVSTWPISMVAAGPWDPVSPVSPVSPFAPWMAPLFTHSELTPSHT